MANISMNIQAITIITACICGFSLCQQAYGQQKSEGLHSFEKLQISSTFYAEGAGIGDINQDGNPDVVAGPYWYEGPDFETRQAFYEPQMFDPRNYSDNFIVEVHDVNGDGWNDILIVGFPGEEAYWYENPQDGEERWQRHLIHSRVDNESPTFHDLTGNGELELVFHTDGYLGYASTDSNDPTQPWSFNRISEQNDWGKFTHGLGIGDIDGDGLEDVIKKEGWWKNPGPDNPGERWEYNKADFGTDSPGGAQMYVYDIDDDGHQDVISTLDAHGWGLAWYRQVPGSEAGSEAVEFEQRLIMGESLGDNPHGVRFSQPHALELVDIDNDGIKDLVSGKRFWAHGPLGGFEPNAPAVVYWFKLVRSGEGRANFIPYLVDDNSGIGVEIATGDLTGNGYPDIVTSNKQGTFIFLNRPANGD